MTELWDILDENGNKTGRLHVRGEHMKKGDYHLTVYVWIINSKGEFLISKRTPNKPFAYMWECTGGNAVTGDDSLTTAIKEAKEELGIVLEPKNGFLYRQHKRCGNANSNGEIGDIWIFRQEVDISEVVLQPNETCDVMWATKEQITSMIKANSFVTWGVFSDINQFFEEIAE